MRRVMGLAVWAAVGGLLMGCDEAKVNSATQEPAAAKSGVVEGKEALAEAPAPTEARPLRPMKEPLFGDVKLGFDHHVFMDNEGKIAEVEQRMLMLESAGMPLLEALSTLEGNLVAAGFVKRHAQDVQGSLIRDYHRNGDLSKTGGQVININAGAYDEEQDGRTGTFNLTLKHNVGK